MIAGAPSVAGGELRTVPPQLMECISPESLARLPAEVLAHNLGLTTEDSHACVVEFTSTHSHYVDLARQAAADVASLTEEEHLEVAEDGWGLFNCMTDEELAGFQETCFPLLVP